MAIVLRYTILHEHVYYNQIRANAFSKSLFSLILFRLPDGCVCRSRGQYRIFLSRIAQ